MYKAFFLLLLVGVLYKEYKNGVLKKVVYSVIKPLNLVMASFSFPLIIADTTLFLRSASGGYSWFSRFGNIIGDADIVLPILIMLFYAMLLTRDERKERLIGEAICLVVISALFGDLLKVAFGRARPYMLMGPFSFFDFPLSIFDNDYQSFPSGHMLVASTLFSWISARFSGFFRFLFPVPLLLVAYNRLETRNHFVSDLAFSAILGYMIVRSYFKEVRG